MSRRLPRSLKAKWDRVIASDGGNIGLTDCRVFLENKLVNDIFYEGLFKGRPCVVKCSSRAPDSIVNEYRLVSRLYKLDPLHFPEPYACHDGPYAFVVTEKICGERSLADDLDERYADEVVAILDSLYAANVVHRDMLPYNFLIAPDGHLKLIDFQFAVDMRTPRVDPWLKRHPVYHFAVFAAVLEEGRAWWDDAAFASMLFPAMRRRARSRIGRLRYDVRLAPMERARLRLYANVVRLQRLFAPRGSRRRETLDRRLRRLS